MQHTQRLRSRTLPAIAFAILATAARLAGATDSYDPAGRTLSVPSFTVGSVTYTNAVMAIDAIVTPPHGAGPDGSADTYDPVSGQLTVPAVTVTGSSATYFNVVVTVRGLDSIGAVSGADVYKNGYLAAASVQAGGASFSNVILAVTPQRLVAVHGGMPADAVDHYDGANSQLSIPAVEVGGKVYTNVVITAAAADIVSTGPPATLAQVQADIFTPHCSFCHNGASAYLPGVQNLSSASATMAALVGVSSLEEPSVLRVAPGDPDASYVIEKLEGAAGIQGARMPRGGPYLSPAQIAEVKSWIVGLSPP
jgi:mono/diheme cytochrome c family protein